MRVSVFAAFLALPAAADEGQYSLSGVAGFLADNPWEEVVFTPWAIEPREPLVFGGGLGYETPLAGPILWGFEANLLAHLGDESHWEIALPVTLRYAPETGLGPVRSLGAGLGLSYASALPEVELDRHGETERTLITWHLELEFGRADAAQNGFLRLHHRSDGFGLIDVDTGSNAVLVGLRQRF